MKRFTRRKPSASMLVAITALVIASSGTAIAAGLVSGDKLIKKHSLSGNRLRNKTLTGAQINLSKLGKVPSAASADKATSATNATNATNAATAAVAVTANNALNLNGAPASAYEPSANFGRSGLIKAASGASTTLATFGPFTLTLKCTAGTSGAVSAEIDATTTAANSDGDGNAMTVGTPLTIGTAVPSGTTFAEHSATVNNFFTATAGQTYIADLTVGQNFPGATASTCFANALVTPS